MWFKMIITVMVIALVLLIFRYVSNDKNHNFRRVTIGHVFQVGDH
jgi:uncharacterized BrkB/YihY/UPF0761 family membrane protein